MGNMISHTNKVRTDPAGAEPDKPARRPDLSDRRLLAWVTILGLALLFYLAAKPGLPDAWQRPGSEILQPLAALGAALLLAPFLFSLGKRGGHSKAPNRLFILHVGASLLGMFLVALHAAAAIKGPPLALVGLLILLAVTGVVARVHISSRMAATFARKPAPFQAADPAVKARLREVIDAKTALLKRLDPQASEALFSPTLKHFLGAPLKSLAYARLARREAQLMGARGSVHWLQAWWRPVHMALAWLFLAGLILHVVLVTLFAGYVADGREIYWWHLAAW
ncbi:MAG: hypothetical protein COW30_01075 [Rhodospirillales bacterium CG15_BIG_FIL_POST_REV_8_21_14_020_66_15]|nr:MAG: hypothetical protein COW30_01075 [Rhodospirillales bacterium CG15_BIG_FIL_POST_REV_8_21_14_020_66_15]